MLPAKKRKAATAMGASDVAGSSLHNAGTQSESAEVDAAAEPMGPNCPKAVHGTLHSSAAELVMTYKLPDDQDSNQAHKGGRLLPTMPSHLSDDDNEPEVPSDCDMDEVPSPVVHDHVGFVMAYDALLDILC
jgi:hypothetical protein